jgi:uncharacterized protein YecA (UPF0149 family)
MINVINLERTQDGGVVVCHWQAEKSDGELTARSYGTKSFTPNPESEGFTAFENLTQEIVVGWFTEEEVAQIESVLDADLEAQKARLEQRMDKMEEEVGEVGKIARQNSGIAKFADKFFWLVIGGVVSFSVWYARTGVSG